MAQPPVLLIDADEDFITRIRRACAEQGLELGVAPSAREGLARSWRELPSALILSVELPDANGFTLCSILKRNPRLKRIPLALVSDREAPEVFLRHRTLRGCAEVYAPKSAPVEDLLEALAPHLQTPRAPWLQELQSIPAHEPALGGPWRSPALWGLVLVLLSGITLAWITLR